MRRPLPTIPVCWPLSYPRHEAVSSAAARSWDAQASEAHGVPSLVLMEHAAMGVASVASLLASPGDRVVVLCGPGNNGGDGYGTARFLRSWGYAPSVLRLAPRPPAGGDPAFEAARAAEGGAIGDAWADPGLVGAALASADLVVDAIFGTGAARVDGPFPAWIAAVNAADALRLAIDVPSGLDADTGEVRVAAVRADVTATMAAPKRGFVAPSPGAARAGRVVEVDIGLPAALHAAHALGSSRGGASRGGASRD